MKDRVLNCGEIKNKTKEEEFRGTREVEGGLREEFLKIQDLGIRYVTCSHQMSLNSQPAYCATGKSSQSIWVFSGFCKIKVYKH